MDDESEDISQDTTPAKTTAAHPYRKHRPKTGFHTWLEMLSWRSPTAARCVADAMARYGRPKLGLMVEAYIRPGAAPLTTDEYDFWNASGPQGRAWCEDTDKLYRGPVDMEECSVEYAHDGGKHEVMCLLTHAPTCEVVYASVPMESHMDQERAREGALDLAWAQLHLGRLVDA